MPPNPDDLTPKARRTRALLLNAGQWLMGQHGIRGVNVMSVCAKANVGRTSFYTYFDDVDSLIKTLTLEAVTQIKTKFDRMHKDQPRGFERLQACLKMILTLAVEDPQTALLLTSLSDPSSEVEDLLYSEIHAELCAMSGHNDKHNDIDVPRLATFLAITLLALVRRHAEGGLPADSMDGHLDLLLKVTK